METATDNQNASGRMCRGRNAGEDRQCASVKNPARPAEDGAAHAKTRASRNLARVCTHRRRSTTIRLLLQMQVHVPLSALQMKSIRRVRVHLAGTPSHPLGSSTPWTRFAIAASILILQWTERRPRRSRRSPCSWPSLLSGAVDSPSSRTSSSSS